MVTMTPEQASFLLQLELPVIKNEHRTTRSVIEAIPSSNSDYRPDPAARTAMELAWHIVAMDHRFFDGIASGEFNFAPNHKPENVRTATEIAQWYGNSFAKNFERLAKLSGEQAAKLIDFRGLFQLPAVGFFGVATRHCIHHRGQLSTYLRAMNGKVPAIYGESYDSAAAKKAAQA